MNKKKSAVWDYFIKTSPSNVKCLLCDAILSFSGSSTGTMNNHLKAKHTNVLKTAAESGDSNKPSTSITTFFKPHATTGKKEKISELLAEWIACDMLPLRIIESPKFKEFIKCLEPEYTVPSRLSLKTRIRGLYIAEMEEIKRAINEADSVAITTDGWTSHSNDSYLSLTAHFIDSEWKLITVLLCTKPTTERKTGESIANLLCDIADSWGLSGKVSACIHDNAPNMRAAATHTDWQHLYCVAHTLQLAVNAGLEIARVSKLKALTSKLVGHFRHSTVAAEALKIEQERLGITPHKLKQFVITRWNSTFYMFQRLLEQKEAILAVLGDRKITTAKDDRDFRLKNEDWNLMENIIPILEPFDIATKSVDADSKVTLPLVYPVLQSIMKNHLAINDIDLAAVKELKSIISGQMQKRFFIGELNTASSPPVVASVLDPRHKHLKYASDELREAAFKHVEELVNESNDSVMQPEKRARMNECANSSKKNVMLLLLGEDYHTAADENEWSIYSNLPLLNVEDNPLQWWKEHQCQLPKLAKLAKQFLGIPATSSTSERAFSTAGHIGNKLRSCLAPENVDMLTFLAKNKIFKRRI